MNLSDFMKNTKTPQEKSSAPDGGLTLNMDAPGVSAKSAETREAQPEAPDQKKKKGKKAKPPRQRHGCLWHFVSGVLGLFLTCGILVVVCVIFLFVWVSRDLPELDKITKFDASQTTTIYARDGSVLGTLSHEKRFIITLSDMPKYLPMSFLAIEDSSFYEHPGINPVAILRALLVNFSRGTKSQGGSTITQQLVKQLLLSPERSYTRKMKEAILAIELEHKLSKDRILSLYLNYVYLGQHAYGVEAAAKTYFGKPAASLTLAEAAMIAGMPQAPSRYNPFRHPEAAKQRQHEVLGRLKTLGWITPEDYEKAINEPLVYWSMPEGQSGAAEWYFEEARRLLIEFFTPDNLKALGVETYRNGEDYVYEAGLTVQTAMDPTQQQLAGEALRRGLEGVDKRQGWRGPLQHLNTEDQKQTFLSKKHFQPDDLLGGKWTQAVVTKNNGSLTVDLGDGYTGVISSGDMDWARHTSKYVGINRKGRIAIEGDVIWVSAVENKKPVAHKEKVQPDKKKGKDKEAAAPEPEYVPGNTMGLKRGVAIPLRLQQEPLVQGALVSIEPQSGDVVALIGGYQFGNSHFNRATQARRQPGSSFKPVVYSAALDNGFTPTSPVLDAPFEYVDPYTHKVWRPGNFEHSYKGEMPLHLALAQSRNIPTVRLCKAIGVDKVIERAKQLGIEPDFPRNLTISLGAVALSPLNLTQAYAAFANGGLGVRPRIITSIKDASGKEIYRQDPEHWVAVTPQNAYQIDMLLQEVVNRGTGSRARIEGRHIAGKTGTSNDTNDVWFIGFTPYLCTGVYVGYDQMHSLGSQEQGGRTAAPIFRNYRVKADEYYNDQPQDFTKPDGIIVEDGLAFQGNPNSGLSATDDSGGTGDDSSLPPPSAGAIAPPVDTSQSGEDLMKESF